MNLKFVKLFFVFLFFTIFSLSAYSENKIVKKSRSNICHAPGTTYYKKTKYYKSYKTLKDCLKSGGRMPKR